MTISGNSDLPVNTSADVLAVFPAFIRKPDTALVRDAIVAMLTVIFQDMQSKSEYAAWQSDILYATGVYLTGLGNDRGFEKHAGETDEQFRARVLQIPQLVTPAAILAAVNSILSSYTSFHARYMEASVDRLFIADGTTTWKSFIGASPSYYTRLYEGDSAANGGVFIPGRGINGAWVFSDTIGRYFVLRIPPLIGSDDQHSFILAGAGSFINDGTNVSGTEATGSVATFMFADRQSAIDIYTTIVNTVNRIKGSSIRWMLYVDARISN